MDVLDIAFGEVGYSESPKNSNKTKYGKWFGFDGVAWCGIFVSWCYNENKTPLEKIGFSTPGFAGCQLAVAHYKKTKRITNSPFRGDLVFFDWNGDGRYDHVGMFSKWIDKDHFETIEGNTAIGNDSNGGQVMKRIRTKKGVLFVHPTLT